MNCSSCGTRASGNQRNCPNCGRVLGASPGGARFASKESALPAASSGLSASSAKSPGPRDGLRDVSSGPPQSNRSEKKSKSKRSREVSLDTPEDSDRKKYSKNGIGGRQIRTLVQDRPDCVEDGLSIYTDSKAEPVGVDYRTDVGPIDLLARDDAGGLVVVMVAPDSKQSSEVHGKELISEALERVGWVRKHVAEPKQEVRAIVLLEHIPDDISYTAAAVASTVAFKTYRLEINFSDVEL